LQAGGPPRDVPKMAWVKGVAERPFKAASAISINAACNPFGRFRYR
jgi:hypothetical protein